MFMQIFSTSRSSCSPSDTHNKFVSRGFTLVDLIISILIISALTAVVLARFSFFDSATILRSLAFEIATTIREAQVFSLSVRGDASGVNFDIPYGVSFTTAEPKDYELFQGGVTYASGDETDMATINSYSIGRSMQISDLCVVVGGSEDCDSGATDIDRLDIWFMRPEFEAHYFIDSNPVIDPLTVDSARIKLHSTLNTGSVWIIEIGRLGNISVFKE